MVDIVGRAKVIIEGDVDPRSVNAAGSKIGAGLRKGLTIGVAAFGTLAAAGIKSVAAFEEAESVSRVLNNTLANMGKSGAAESIDKLADSLQRKTGIDDEVIKKGQTILATFSQVAKSAGEAGGAFERATKLSADLAVSGFGSVDSGAKALGKALQDPIKGITALSRAGVTFTEEQKKLIQTFIETGETAKAQNLILAEVEKQVGGNAEAGAKASAKLKSAIGEAQESLGGLIADLFDTGKEKSLVELAADATFKFSDAVKKFQQSKEWKELKRDIRDFGKDAKTVAGAFTSIVGSMDRLSKKGTGSGLLEWLNRLDKLLNPVRILADQLREIDRLINKIQNSKGGAVAGGLLGILGLSLRAEGGRSLSAGLSVVGEQGPEIIRVPSGSDIYSNRESRQIAASASGGGTVNYNLYGPGSLSEARREQDWAAKYGTRYGAATMAGAL